MKLSTGIRHGFTLIELLVVIAIIALLVAILIPSLSQVRELARRMPCMANEKNMGSAVQVYATSNNEFIPPLKAQVNSGGLCWWWQDWIQPYFDMDAIRSTTTNGWGESIGCQPADGNYSVNMPRYRYSRRMDCPSQKSVGLGKFFWCCNDPYPNYWLYNFADPASNSNSGVSPLPSYHEIGSGWTKGAKTPIRAGQFKNPAGICTIMEPNNPVILSGNDCQYWNFYFVSQDYYRLILSAAAPHLGTCNAVLMDGHVEQFSQSFLCTWTSAQKYPFAGP